MELLISASFIAAYFAGIAALFAPCCISVLLPTYFASIFKQKTLIFLMTFIYFLGLLTIFLPIGLGVTFLTQLFSQYHNQIFLIGSIFLIFLGTVLILGKQFSLPFKVYPKLKNYDVLSVYVLGIFSAIATTCCAPVLAGVLAISAIPGSLALGGIYTLAYVLGIVTPLFVIATCLDKSKITQKFLTFKKTLTYNFFGQKILVTVSNLISGLMFLILGSYIFYLAQTNQIAVHDSLQVAINIYLTNFIKSISLVTNLIPEFVWALLFVGIFLVALKIAASQFLSLLKKVGINEK
ncbi:MAG: hypothetical protein HY429_04160 [Candidatus Levybacteria bacterium]|nr:hypothetical protein [Candidatus Levybacteria bacterium]